MPQKLPDPPDDIEFVSNQEQWVYQTLMFFRQKGWIINFWYQVQSGNYRIDFVVANPFMTVLEPTEEHWHTGQLGADDWYRLILIGQRYKRIVLLNGAEVATPEITYKNVYEWIILRAGQSKLL